MTPSPTVRRHKILALTPKGTEYNTLMKTLSQELVTKFYKGFSEDEIAQFQGFLERIESNFS